MDIITVFVLVLYKILKQLYEFAYFYLLQLQNVNIWADSYESYQIIIQMCHLVDLRTIIYNVSIFLLGFDIYHFRAIVVTSEQNTFT